MQHVSLYNPDADMMLRKEKHIPKNIMAVAAIDRVH